MGATKILYLRLTPDELQAITEAAARSSQMPGTWAVEQLLLTARDSNATADAENQSC